MGLLLSSSWSIIGLPVAVVIMLPGYLWPYSTISLPYRAWNKLASYVETWARTLLLMISYYTVILAVGRTSSRFTKAGTRPRSSGWVPVQKSDEHAYKSQYVVPIEIGHSGSWLSEYFGWALQSQNLWALSLLPHFALLAAIDSGEQENTAVDIYTLF